MIYTRVIGLESQDNVALGEQNDSIPPHRNLGEARRGHVRVFKCASLLFRTPNSLEATPVDMEGVSARVEIVHYQLDDLVFFKDERVGVFAVYRRVRGEVSCG